jgi:hypothetical protein
MSTHTYAYVIYCEVGCSILDVCILFDNHVSLEFQWNFHGIWIYSMESRVDVAPFHMESMMSME